MAIKDLKLKSRKNVEVEHTEKFYRDRVIKLRRAKKSQDEADSVINKYNLARFPTIEEVDLMPPEARKAEFKREYEIASGKFEKSMSTRAKENLMKMLDTIGLTEEQLQFVDENISRQWIQAHSEEFEWWFGSIFKETYWNENGKRMQVMDDLTKSDIRDDFWAGMMNLLSQRAHNKGKAQQQELQDKWEWAQEQKAENQRIYLGVDHPEEDNHRDWRVSNSDLADLEDGTKR